MDLNAIVTNIQLFLLIFTRVFAMLQIAPLFSSGAVPQIARIALALFCAVACVGNIVDYPIPDTGLEFVFLLVAEALIGFIMGLLLTIIYSAFQLSGQFFSMQMGFAASQVFDPLAQIEIPILGQFLNLMAMLVMLTVKGFQKLFLVGVYGSFNKVRPWDLVNIKENLLHYTFESISSMFYNALLIALPIIGTLLIVSISMGLLAKASPQMNLLMLGFPINISVSYVILMFALPFIITLFAKVIENSFDFLLDFITKSGGL